MARPRTIPDGDVFAAIRALLAQGGDKAVAFSSVARATGLAAPTLVQRYGTREGMVKAALLSAWDALDNRTDQAEAAAPLNGKGAVALLKSLGEQDSGPDDLALLAVEFRDAELRARAEAWRARIEAALATRLGGGAKGQELGAILFAAWQGQALWAMAGGRSFRLKDAVKRLG